jgi:hypothetical protein
MKFQTIIAALAACFVCGAASEAQVQPTAPEGIDSIRITPKPLTSGPSKIARRHQAQPMPLRKIDPAKVRSAISGKVAVTSTSVSSKTAPVPKSASGNVHTGPLVHAGRLFFTKPGPDGDRACSAQLISRRLIVTAAHCVKDPETGEFYDNFEFDLQYEKGRYAATFGVECLAVRKGWVGPDPDNHAYDYAIVTLDRETDVGSLGTHSGWKKSQYNSATKIGYPNGVADGKIIQVNRGPLTLEGWMVGLRHGVLPEQAGSSGGAFIGNYSTNDDDPDANYVISVMSFQVDGQTAISYGPYLDNGFYELLEHARTQCQ